MGYLHLLALVQEGYNNGCTLFHFLQNCIWGSLDRRKTDGQRSEISDRSKAPRVQSKMDDVTTLLQTATCTSSLPKRLEELICLTFQTKQQLWPSLPNFRVVPTRSTSASWQGNSRLGVYSLHYTITGCCLWNGVASPWQPSWNWKQKPIVSSWNGLAFLNAPLP